MAEYQIFLSTDGKHTVNTKIFQEDEENRKEIVKRSMDLYDFIVTKYGTKQAQAVKEYSKDKKDEANCKHELTTFKQSKTEKNPGRWFKSCNECGKFLGWQD